MNSSNLNDDREDRGSSSDRDNRHDREQDPLSPEGMQLFEQWLQAGANRAVAIEPEVRQLVRYLSGLLAPQEARLVERGVNGSPAGRRQLLATQKSLRRLRAGTWKEVERRADAGDEIASIWWELARQQAGVQEEGRALWNSLPCVNVWTEIQAQRVAGEQQARAAWTAFLSFAEQWKSLRRIEGLRPAVAKGLDNRPTIYAPQIVAGGDPTSRGELNTDLDPQLQTTEFSWNAQITQAGDLRVEALWTVEDLGEERFQATGGLLSMRSVQALWPIAISECVDQTEQEPDNPFRTWAAIWVVPGFGKALGLNPGRLGATNFRIDLTDRPPSEFLTEALPELLEDMLSELPGSRSPLVWPSAEAHTMPRIMVAEIYTQDGEPTNATPVLLSLAAPPTWNGGHIEVELLLPNLVLQTYADCTLVVEAGITERSWQQLGAWPLREWPADNAPQRLTMSAPGEPNVPFTTPLRTRLVQSDIDSKQ